MTPIDAARSQLGVADPTAFWEAIWPDHPSEAVDWCAIFVSWAFAAAGSPLPRIESAVRSGFAWCPDLEMWAKALGYWYLNPAPGDIVLYSWSDSDVPQHTGIVESVASNETIVAVEGNTGSPPGVRREVRNLSACVGFVRLPGVTMTMIDCSQRISGAGLAAAGIQIAGRYLSSFSDPKDVTPSEVEDIHAHGVALLLIGEDGTGDLTSGVGHAQALASAYVRGAEALGAPQRVGICLTCDNNGASSLAVRSAGAAGAEIIHQAGFLAGFYGPKDPARALKAAGDIDFTFVVDTWGADQPGDIWNFRQLPNSGQRTIGGVTCDIDDAPAPVGLWLPGGGLSGGTGDLANLSLLMEMMEMQDNGAIVRLLYRSVMKRNVDPAGYTTFVNHLNAGGTVESVVQSLTDSGEGVAVKDAERKLLGLAPM